MYNEKPQLHLYEYKNNTFSQIAIIDDYSEISFERNLYQAGQFTITINHNLPNASKFEKGLFIQFGSDPYDFGEIRSISDSIGSDGKGSQNKIISGFDCRYLYKRRIIKNLNNNDTWQMTAKGEICLRSLIYSEAGEGAEVKRRLPITNTIPTSQNAIGKEYSVSEAYTNLYDVLVTIATQSEIGWRVKFENNSLSLECYQGEDKHTTVQFSTDFETLSNGTFTDTNENFSNAVYVGGKGDGSERDIYEGESAINNSSPAGFDRFECWDNQSEMNTEDEYSKEALSMLTQYGQTLTVNGNGLAKSIYVYKEQYNVGDIISISFSGRKANVQILSVTEHWTGRGNYGITFSFGKPVNNLADQIKLLLNKIQIASSKANTIDSVKWYEFSNANLSQDKKDVTFNSIGFTGTLSANRTFTFYLDDEGTGSKIYNIYAKNLSGNFNVTLTTGKSGATNAVIKGGVNLVARVYVDVSGNVVLQSMSATDTIQSGNNQPVTSSAVADKILGTLQSTGDLNNFTTFGIYQFIADTTNITNAPNEVISEGVLYGILEVSLFGDYIYQKLTTFYSGFPTVYIRRRNPGNVWGIWVKYQTATSKELPQNTDLNNVRNVGIYSLGGVYVNTPNFSNSNVSGTLIVEDYTPNHNSTIQLLKRFQSGNAYFYTRRLYNNGSWGDWYPLTTNLTLSESVEGTYAVNEDIIYKKTIVDTMPDTTNGTFVTKDITLGISINKILKFDAVVTNRAGVQYQYPMPMVTSGGYKISCQLYAGKLRIGTDWHDVGTGEVRITLYYTK